MAIVKFYRGDPNAPKTTMPAHLGANAIITCQGKLLLEKRRDSDTWGLVGGGVKKTETELQARIVLFRPAADLTFMSRSFSSAFVCFSLKLSLTVHLFRRDAAFVQTIKV